MQGFNFTIAKKMILFAIVIFVTIFITGLFKFNNLIDAEKSFDTFKDKAIAAKFYVLEVEKELNFVARNTRDIMLGNAYERNIKNLENSKAKIIDLFEKIVNITETKEEKEKVLLVKQTVIDFVEDGYQKMKSMENIERTPEVRANMYIAYRKDATPLANKSRENFSKLIKEIEDDYNLQTQLYHTQMNDLKNIIIIESLLIITIVILSLMLLSRDILLSLNRFKSGLISFFDFLNKNSSKIEYIDIKNSDEFGLMAKLINSNIEKIENSTLEDKKLLDDVFNVVNRVKQGYYSQLIKENSTNDTLSTLKNSINDMISATKQNFISVNNILEEYVKYNYTKELKLDNIEKGGAFETLIKNINELRNAINDMLIKDKENGITLDNSSSELLKNVDKLNQSSNEAAASLEETAAALEEVTSSISNSNNKIAQMSQIASNVTNSASLGEKLANQTTTAMDEINTQVNLVNEAIGVIDNIAFQTNILSLNAAVEAATAGEAGKGFAVVAQEVRNLATRSAEAAKEIKEIVERATVKANEGKSIATNMIEGYKGLNESINQTTSLIQDIASSSKEQQNAVIQINDAISLLDKKTQENAQIAGDTNSIAEKASLMAKKILENVNEKEFLEKNVSEESKKSSSKEDDEINEEIDKNKLEN
ncbi:methyl-accepting chemotaxis protein [Aliarcobacter skirrowii]|uniref:Chemotaxis protein n=1 Tax=Aliarcobacter skirrowii CCUG 10374 TaxID=1032239 RepID=A0AAD0SKW1_9BACT|nr:methyl-accepting chemotaxis protein [Aliarcobacter skirrowii]AXX84559.1 MCP-domain signal transduction protein [Aliarcobacter skirrowii CCUG 10374]KAB0621269.1 methyl-accepting chemotaxis protein [Aliarcobacter skirrowii CCUG 10374]RXI26525.1 chemotaxis protein [Aliarcobacter skirrowii CCUG 10374]SUV14718.1 Aspartate chemoreceptor protein [Aliarcobacter skirrowii]